MLKIILYAAYFLNVFISFFLPPLSHDTVLETGESAAGITGLIEEPGILDQGGTMEAELDKPSKKTTLEDRLGDSSLLLSQPCPTKQ